MDTKYLYQEINHLHVKFFGGAKSAKGESKQS